MEGKMPFDVLFVKLDFGRSVEKAAEHRRSPKRSAHFRGVRLMASISTVGKQVR
jgi:hypothetical protein